MADFYQNHCYVYDADTCGDDRYTFFFDNGEAYTFEHSWWIQIDPEWEIFNEWTHTAIDPDNVPSWMKVDRDWL
jgi:hypothetical protein